MVGQVASRNRVFDERAHWRHPANTIERPCAVDMTMKTNVSEKRWNEENKMTKVQNVSGKFRSIYDDSFWYNIREQESLAVASIARDVVVEMTPPRDHNAR